MNARASLWTRPFVIGSLANFLNGLAVMLYLHLPGLLERWGEDDTTIGLVAASMAAGAVLVRPFAGRAMDGGGGRRAVVLIGSVGHVCACAGYLAIDHVGPLLWIVRVAHGVSEGALFAALFTSAADIVPIARRTEGLALFGVSGMLPVALGGVIGDLVLAHADYRELFLLALGCAVGALLISLALPETGGGRRPSGQRGRGFVAVATQRDLLPIWVIGLSLGAALGAGYAFLKKFFEIEHVGSVGLFYGWYAAVAIALRILLGWVPERVGPTRVLAPSLLAITVALALLSSARDASLIAIAGALAGLGHGYAFPILSGMTAGRSRDEERGSAMSLWTAVFDFGMLFAGPIFGAISDATSLRTMFGIAACVPVAGVVVFHAWEAWLGDRR